MQGDRRTTMGDLGEHAVIAALRGLLSVPAGVRTPVGDDTAVVALDANFDGLLTSDAVLAGVHFGIGDDPRAVGHKAVGRVLSDFAAMGGEPLWLLVDLVAPTSQAMAWVRGAYEGMNEMAVRHGAGIVGGDTTCADGLGLHVFGMGRVPKGRAVLRSGARAGDILYATGTLGGSRAGKHLSFEPRLAEGAWLAGGGWATAMLDLSDGLACDLRHLANASGVGAEVWAESVPISDAARNLADERSPLDHALSDGEDFELLFTVGAERRHAFEAAWARDLETRCTAIGRMHAGPPDLSMVRVDGLRVALERGGFEHFRVTDG